MIFDLIGNLVLFVFFAYCFINLELTTPQAEAGSMPAKAWPQALLVILCVCIIFNLISTYRKMKADGKKFMDVPESLKKLFDWRILCAIVLCFVYVFSLRFIGYFPASVVFLPCLIFLLGARNWKPIVFWTLGLSIGMFLVFRILLSVPLPRGMGVFREFALFVESLIS